MSTVNFNDTTPAAPTYVANVKFQSDASGNISAYYPGALWQNWTLSVIPGGSMTITTGPTVDYAKWVQEGHSLRLLLRFAATFGGTANSAIFLGFPAFVPSDNFIYTGYGFFSSTGAGAGPLMVQMQQGVGFTVNLTTGSNYTLGTSYTFTVGGNYPV
jgi:hypothetical protein